MLTWAVAWLLTRRKDIHADAVGLLVTVTCMFDAVIFYLAFTYLAQ